MYIARMFLELTLTVSADWGFKPNPDFDCEQKNFTKNYAPTFKFCCSNSRRYLTLGKYCFQIITKKETARVTTTEKRASPHPIDGELAAIDSANNSLLYVSRSIFLSRSPKVHKEHRDSRCHPRGDKDTSNSIFYDPRTKRIGVYQQPR